ncbi:MAG: N-acetylmuramoyl-L-alanine amidase [Candidatus Rokubacteria bacterium]|nr:N-acetylmuramoyl-L-alanine amidase [Candidatus Rokubacteria bacterium]
MRRLFLGWVLAGLALGLLGRPAHASSLLLRVEGRELGLLPAIVTEEGRGYVSLDHLAQLLEVKPHWAPKTSQAMFRVGQQAVQLTKNRAQVLVRGKPVQLSAPPRVLQSGWAVPEEFVTTLLPRILPALTVVKAQGAAKPARQSVALEDLRFRSYPSFTRVVLEGSGRFDFLIQSSRERMRVVLSGLSIEAPRTEEIADGLIRQLRLEQRGREVALTIHLETVPEETRTLALEEPFRLVLDLYRSKATRPDALYSPAQPLRFIVLDAGHGGQDPGATGPSGLQEKSVVLDVTKRLARMLEEGLGIKVALTRTGDYFVPLPERTAFANAQRADLFVSIHANAHRASVSEGVETYFLSSEASDNDARQVAALENGVLQLESPTSRGKLDILKTILWDLAQSEFQEESSHLAETVLDSVTESLRIPNRGVKQAGFYVLGGAAMPAVLVEVGFLTNRKEEQKLRDPRYRERVARAIYAGLAEYKRRYDQKMKVSLTEGSR